MANLQGLSLASVALALLAAPAPAQRLDAQYTGTNVLDFAGYSVGSGFDCDGDGVADVAVGMRQQMLPGGFSEQGVVRVYSGATHAELGYYSYNATDAWAGSAVALVGDMDGDGLSDVVYGATGVSNGGGYVAAWSVKNNVPLWWIFGSNLEKLGASIAAAGDVDKDGCADVIVGAPDGCNVYLVSGHTGTILHAWHGTQSSAAFGQGVSGNVDVDGDGTPDVIVGSPLYDSAFPFKVDRGRVDVYSGATYATIWTQTGDNAGDELGWAVAGLGDINGDGRAEVLAGAPLAGTTSTWAGLVRKYDGTGAKLSDLTGALAGDQFGTAIAIVPDLTGDGLPEYVVGAPQNGNGGYATLQKGDDDSFLWNFSAPDPNDFWYGVAVAGGDLDGDGLGDVVVGDPSRTVNGAIGAGAADVWITVNATATSYGSGYPGTFGVPSLTAQDDPGIGTTFSAGVSNSRGVTTTGLVIVGFTRLNVPTSAGGTLLVAPFEILPIPIPATGALLSGAIPDDPGLLGVVVDLQVLELDPGAAHHLSFTPGLELLIGVDYP
jgi:hypothetical protein